MRIRKSGVYISGTGSAIPSKIVTNDFLAAQSPTNSSWVKSTLGIESRRHLNSDETLLSLCISAAKLALMDAGKAIEEMDAIIVATSTPDFLNPSMASQLHGALGAKSETAAFDIQAVCSGFLFGLGVAVQIVTDDLESNVLVLGADQFSKITDFAKRDSVFFGDGTGAAVISRSTDPEAFIAVDLYTDSSNWEGFHTPSKEGKFSMTGRLVKETATRELPVAIRKIIGELGFTLQDIDALFPHQPSKVVLDELEESLDLRPGVLKRNIEHRGNTAGATVPLLLDEYLKTSKLKPGALVAFAAIGSGWTWGAAVTKWIKA